MKPTPKPQPEEAPKKDPFMKAQGDDEEIDDLEHLLKKYEKLHPLHHSEGHHTHHVFDYHSPAFYAPEMKSDKKGLKYDPEKFEFVPVENSSKLKQTLEHPSHDTLDRQAALKHYEPGMSHHDRHNAG